MLMRIVNHPTFFWAVLALPSLAMLAAIADGLTAREAHELLHPTGEFAARFMILAMMLTPLRMLFPQSRALLWLMRRRRHLGVAAFAYAALHTLFYLIDKGSLASVLGEALEFGIWTGWLAFFVFLPLAATSNNLSVSLLGPRWKRLQQFVYLAAVATLLHWIFVELHVGPALVHFLPLAALEGYRVWKTAAKRQQPA